jgi:hypothetical protein
VDKDHDDPETELARSFKCEVELYDSQNKLKNIFHCVTKDDESEVRYIIPNLKSEEYRKRFVEIQVPDIGKYKMIVNIGYAGRQSCSGQCFQSYEFDHTVKGLPTRIFALIIGIDRYKDEALNLHFPDDDADSIEQFLVGVLEVPRKHIKKLTSKKATKSNIWKAIQELKKEVTSEDILIVYYSGHGFLLEKDFFFAPHEAIQSPEVDWFGDYISIYQWNSWLNIKIKYLILFQDSCFSGALIDDSMRNFWNKYWKQKFGSKQRYAILASLPSQKAYEVFIAQNGVLKFATQPNSTHENAKVNGHGLFTYALLYAIEQIIEEDNIRIDLNHDKKCGKKPCSKAEKHVGSKIKENKTKIGLLIVYQKLAVFMEQFTSQHKEELNQGSQTPMLPGDISGAVPTLMHHELLFRGQ